MTFQTMILRLQEFWAEQECSVLQPYDLEMGAGTFAPHTALKALGDCPWRLAYVQPCRRPKDGRYGDNPNRLGSYHQFQVLLKPAPRDIRDLYLQSLTELGVDPAADFKWNEDNWESPTLGAAGLGWECLLNGMEISQFTYFQQIMGIPCQIVSGEITYGLERLALHLQDVDSVFDIQYSENLTYADLFMRPEREFSKFSLEEANTEFLQQQYEQHLEQGAVLAAKSLPLPAYDCCIKASHIFNLLDARGVISVSERQQMILTIRDLAGKCGQSYLEGETSCNRN